MTTFLEQDDELRTGASVENDRAQDSDLEATHASGSYIMRSPLVSNAHPSTPSLTLSSCIHRSCTQLTCVFVVMIHRSLNHSPTITRLKTLFNRTGVASSQADYYQYEHHPAQAQPHVRLPLELIHVIINFAPDRNTLLQCTLVCRAWMACSRQAVFGTANCITIRAHHHDTIISLLKSAHCTLSPYLLKIVIHTPSDSTTKTTIRLLRSFMRAKVSLLSFEIHLRTSPPALLLQIVYLISTCLSLERLGMVWPRHGPPVSADPTSNSVHIPSNLLPPSTLYCLHLEGDVKMLRAMQNFLNRRELRISMLLLRSNRFSNWQEMEFRRDYLSKPALAKTLTSLSIDGSLKSFIALSSTLNTFQIHLTVFLSFSRLSFCSNMSLFEISPPAVRVAS